jgi:protocatechuate 3,4-dioxygenase beta subunit
MHRRTFLGTLSAALPLIAWGRSTAAQDLEYIAAVQRAQARRPATLQTTARIAPESEPGTPLVIHGRLHLPDGAPLAGATVFAYHTDRTGIYDQPSAGPHSWRLRGWALTDRDGRFEFRTIRPGAYPSRNQAAHVHFAVFTKDATYSGGGLLFDDDPLVSDSERSASRAKGEFGDVRPVRTENGTQHVDLAIRIDPKQRF